jgi:stage III sporulation protein AA
MAVQYLSAAAGNAVDAAKVQHITEIRLRTDKPLLLRTKEKAHTLPYRVTASDIAETMERMSRHSYYAFETELAQGYITLPGGHRVGVAGQAVVENGFVRTWRHIGALAIRIAHSVPGCADGVLPALYTNDRFFHTLIISPPGFGKTTLLRDIVRQISDAGLTVGLVDERSEVAGCFAGVPQNDVGIRTDVLDGVPKDIGMAMLLRAMAPQVIAADELGGTEDARAVEAVLKAGVKLLCTAHGYSLNDIKGNPLFAQLIKHGAFERFVVLDAPGRVQGVYTKDGGLC